jgi:ribosome-binding factor A
MPKTTYKRAERVADQIRMEVAEILMRRIKDPRVRSVTVTDVELTSDLRLARIYVTTMEREDAERLVFDGLAKAAGFIRAELGKRLALRYLPDLTFIKDISGPRGDRILQLLESLHHEDDEPTTPPASPIIGRTQI